MFYLFAQKYVNGEKVFFSHLVYLDFLNLSIRPLGTSEESGVGSGHANVVRGSGAVVGRILPTLPLGPWVAVDSISHSDLDWLPGAELCRMHWKWHFG